MMRRRLLPPLLALLLAASCGGGGEPEPPLPRPTRGYVLISFDTLRADHLGAYGYERDTSPFFDELAARGTLFTRAVVQYPSTLTSHMSMLTGLYPAEHGVYPPDGVLPEGIETVAEVFRRHGFSTAAHTEGGFVRGRFGFRRGFEEFRARDRRGPREIEHTFARGVEFLDSLGPEERFFLFLHTYAVHTPYRPPPGYENLFWEGEPPEAPLPPTGPALARHNAEGGELPPEVVAWFRSLYDATLRHADDTLRDFFAELERLGLPGDVTVILTSDHGEEFQEHGRMNHEQLYEEVMRVPLLVLHPDLPGARRGETVESVDLAPTLYELARLEPEAPPSGDSFAHRLGRPGAAGGDEAWAEVDSGVRALWRSEQGRPLHLLLFEPPEERWASRRLKLDTAEESLAFEARSYGAPRELTVTRLTVNPDPSGDADPSGDTGPGETLGAFALTPEWTPVEVTPGPAAGKHTLVLSVPECTVVEEERWHRCLGFQVRGVPQVRLELYDVAADPRETRDLSAADPQAVRELLRRLSERRFTPRAAAEAEALDPETEEQLRALGYLQ